MHVWLCSVSINEGCSTSNSGCNTAAGLTCDAGTNTCQCPSGQTWLNVFTGTATPGYQCIDITGKVLVAMLYAVHVFIFC